MSTIASKLIASSRTIGGLGLATFVCLNLAGCPGLQVNLPIYVQQIKQQDAALLVRVENRSSRQIKVTYPIATGFLRSHQHVVFPVANQGSHKIVVSAYSEDRRYSGVFNPVKTVEIPIFLNGHDLIRTNGQYVGYQLVVTDGMLLANR